MTMKLGRIMPFVVVAVCTACGGSGDAPAGPGSPTGPPAASAPPPVRASANYRVLSDDTGASSGLVASSNYRLTYSAGEFSSGSTSTSPNYKLTGGFAARLR